jgi:hypothetical protein
MKTKNKIIVILCIGLFLFLSLNYATAFAYDIYGITYQSNCRTPLTGVIIKLYNYSTGSFLSSTTSDYTGSYRFTNASSGVYRVEASVTGYATESIKVIITRYNKKVNFCLKAAGTINGTVTEADGISTIAGATIEAKLIGGSTQKTSTASDGTYTISNLKAGTYFVTASATGYLPSKKLTKVTAGGITNLDFSLTKEAVIKGKVVKTDGTPIDGATIEATLQSTTETYFRAVSADSNGNYTLTAKAGTYDLKVYKLDYGAQLAMNVHASAGATTTVDFVLSPEGWIKGQVTGGSGPIKGATVQAMQMGRIVWRVSTDLNGNYTIEMVNGTYDVMVSAAGYISTVTTDIVVISGVITKVDFNLTPD